MKSSNSTLHLPGFFLTSTASILNLNCFLRLLPVLFLFTSLASFAGNYENDYSAASPSSTQSMRINLYLLMANNTTILADGVLTEYNNAYHDSVTLEDAYKFTNINENLGLTRYGHILAVERRPIISTADTLYLQLWKTTARNYQFEFETISLDHPGMKGFLEDTYLGTSLPLSLAGTTKTNFSVTSDPASANISRFRIVYRDNYTAAPVRFSFVKANVLNTKITVQWQVENEINLDRYEVEGSVNGVNFIKVNSIVVDKQNGARNTYSLLDENHTGGNNFYRIKGVDRSGSQNISPVVKINDAEKNNSSITIYPNPIKGNKINVRFANEPAGTYLVRLINNNGQVVYSGILPLTGGNISQTLYTNKKLTGGIYQLEVKAPDNTINVQQAFVQE